MWNKSLFICFLLVLSVSIVSAQTSGKRKRPPRPHEYGNVVIENYAEAGKVNPVVFKHWLHRSKYTCRLCHIDIGFAMEAGGTDITEDDIRNGLFCGTCHNGKEAFAPEEKPFFGEVQKNCELCHSYGQKVEFKNNFKQFTKGFPRARYGNKIDWLKAEEKGLIKLVDFMKGISLKQTRLDNPTDANIKPAEDYMPDILFSHQKHAVWNGCELCHPELFGVKKEVTVYSMQDIFEGRFCGACHGKVAFTNSDCTLCHTKSVY
jgi:c(7)-type cytochrome triheme protein